MQVFYLLLFIFCCNGKLTAQQFDLHQRSFKYDFDSLGMPARYTLKGDVVFSIDNNGVIIDNIKSNYYYKTKGQFWEFLQIKNLNLGRINEEVKKTNFSFQVYFIEKKLIGDVRRRHVLKDEFSQDMVEIISHKIKTYFMDNIGFKNIEQMQTKALGENNFKSRIFFKSFDKVNSLYLPFASNLIKTKSERFTIDYSITLICGLIENHKDEEYLHLELILNKGNGMLIKTAINVFYDWSSIDVNEFEKDNYFHDEIVESLFHEIF